MLPAILRNKSVLAIAGVAVLALIAGAQMPGAKDKYALKAPNGVAFEEFRGYEDWKDVAVSQVKDGIKAILANDTMIAAYRKGIPGNGKAFPDGSMVVKIEWSQKTNPQSPYFVMIPDRLMSLSFIEKDSKRFADTSGWGYAQFLYDPKSGTFKPYGANANFGKDVCYACHTAVKANDYIFTAYPFR